MERGGEDSFIFQFLLSPERAMPLLSSPLQLSQMSKKSGVEYVRRKKPAAATEVSIPTFGIKIMVTG